MNEGMYTSVVELSRLMSKPIQESSFHFIVIAISVAPESFFHWIKSGEYGGCGITVYPNEVIASMVRMLV